MVCFNYRKVPAVALAKGFIDEGRLGEIRHFRAVYLQDWIADPNLPVVWKLRKDLAGSGAHGDLNSHIIDLARYLVGEFSKAVGMKETFIRRRPKPKMTEELTTGLAAEAAEGMNEVTVDDATFVTYLPRHRSGSSLPSKWRVLFLLRFSAPRVSYTETTVFVRIDWRSVHFALETGPGRSMSQ